MDGAAMPSAASAWQGRERDVPRRAVSLARRIERDIGVSNLPQGAVFGSQGELRVRYGAGGGSLDEAIRILEFNGVGHMRPGPGGGLLVGRPPLGLVLAAVHGYWRSLRSAGGLDGAREDLDAARAALAELAGRMAAERGAGDRRWAARLRILLVGADPAVALAQALGDPGLDLAARCLSGLGGETREAALARSWPETAAAPRRLVQAILAGDPAAAGRWARATMQARCAVEHLAPGPAVNPFLADGSPMNRSRVGRLVWIMAADISRQALWRQGGFGSEAALAERYAVARATLRQALRVLEDARIVSARRGRAHGWVACAPTLELPVRQMRRYLAGHGMRQDQARRLADGWRGALGGDRAGPGMDLLLRGLAAV